MGKPSSQQLSKKSNHSLNSNTSQRMQSSMSSQKVEVVRRKQHRKTKNKIKNLFEKLKRQSVSSFDTQDNITVISLDNSETNDTVIDTACDTVSRKRKNELTNYELAKRRKSDNSLILITDDDVTINNDPCPLSSPRKSKNNITCSTPISRQDSKTIQNMIINNFPKSNNNNSSINFNEDVINLTKEIHKDSYLTIDLTADSEVNKTNNTVIDVDKTLHDGTQTLDCSLISISNASLSMSGDSDVTIVQNNRARKKQNSVNKFARGISKLNPSEKGKLLELIAENIFNGCKVSKDVKNSLENIRLQTQSQATETVQDTFIKEVILGESKSRNSIGSNIYHPSKDDKNKKGLRMIVIDGSNVAMEHTKGCRFSVQGLKICIDYFLKRGHVVKAFVPRFRCKYGKSTDPRLLDHLERQGLVVYTPSREIQGRTCTPYDDRYIVQCAAEFDGVIVSGDNYRDLLKENPRWRFVIENRLLPFTWVDDMIMFPRDPLGRNGPTLEQFLRHPESSEKPIVL